MNIRDVDAEARTVTEVLDDLFFEVAHRDCDVPNAVALQKVNDVFQDWTPADGDERFGNFVRGWSEGNSRAAREDHRLAGIVTERTVKEVFHRVRPIPNFLMINKPIERREEIIADGDGDAAPTWHDAGVRSVGGS
jgi:hypothetical protein